VALSSLLQRESGIAGPSGSESKANNTDQLLPSLINSLCPKDPLSNANFTILLKRKAIDMKRFPH
jgi:hypothetical protein